MLTIADTLIEQGILQNAQEDVIDILEVRFEGAPQSIVKTIHDIHDPSILKILLRKAIKVESIEEFERLLEAMMK